MTPLWSQKAFTKSTSQWRLLERTDDT